MSSHRTLLAYVLAIAGLTGAGCAKPTVERLRESFAQQLAANPSVKDFQQSGEELTFLGPGDEGTAKWRVHIDSADIETTEDTRTPYKGVIKSSWYANGRQVLPSSDGRRSNLPPQLIANGLAQECWALWDAKGRKWGWE
jgi:hypothetical protein